MTGSGNRPHRGLLQDLLLESAAIQDFVLGLAMLPVSLLGGSTPLICAITVQRDNALSVAASSAGQARRLELLQQALDEGPSLVALRGQETVVVAPLRADGRWAMFADAARGEGMRSVLAVPVGGIPSVGFVLTCYSTSETVFDDATVDAVREIAASMSRTVQLALSDGPHRPASDGWRAALQSRAVVDGAVALIMGQDGCTRAEALILLRQGARTGNRTLLHEAGRVIEGKFPRTT
jgi:GAF domain-containing protein